MSNTNGIADNEKEMDLFGLAPMEFRSAKEFTIVSSSGLIRQGEYDDVDGVISAKGVMFTHTQAGNNVRIKYYWMRCYTLVASLEDARQRAMRLLAVKRLFAVLGCAGLLCVSAPALAAGRADDTAATRAYLRASEAYARGVSAAVGASVTAIAARANGIAGECPSALTYAPRDVAFGEIGEEMSVALFYAGVAPTRTTRLGFARAVGGLSWSDRRLTRLVRALAAEEVAIVAVALPDVCADIGAWKASAYAALPRSTTGFLVRVAAVESGSYVGPSEESREAAIGRLLAPYEGPGVTRKAKRLERQEQRTGRMLGVAAEAARARLAAALGVSGL